MRDQYPPKPLQGLLHEDDVPKQHPAAPAAVNLAVAACQNVVQRSQSGLQLKTMPLNPCITTAPSIAHSARACVTAAQLFTPARVQASSPSDFWSAPRSFQPKQRCKQWEQQHHQTGQGLDASRTIPQRRRTTKHRTCKVDNPNLRCRSANSRQATWDWTCCRRRTALCQRMNVLYVMECHKSPVANVLVF